MEELAPAIATVALILGIGWIVRLVGTNRRILKMAAMRAELQTRMLEKFGSAQELVAYLEAEAGQDFLEAPPTEKISPYGKILSSIQAGIVLTVLGVALLFLRGQMQDSEEAFVFLGAIGLALGIGFLISAAASYGLSKSWGLVNGNSEVGRGA